jgi:hypothetical protein
MDNSLNQSIIEKVITKNVAIHIALNTMCPPQFEDKFRNESLCQKNTQTQNLGKSLNVVEPNNVNVANDTMNNTKTNLEVKSWRDITDPKLREKMRFKEWYENNKVKRKEKMKEWYDLNKDKVKKRTKSHYENNKDLRKSQMKSYQVVNKDKIKDYQKTWRESNKNTRNVKRRERTMYDVQYKLSGSLRRRLRCALRGNYKSGSAVKDLGCTIDELKTYLESKFLNGMTWDNYGLRGWHIDHIKPLSSFDLSDRKQMLEACHYTNLQPLWAKDNLVKSDNLN